MNSLIESELNSLSSGKMELGEQPLKSVSIIPKEAFRWITSPAYLVMLPKNAELYCQNREKIDIGKPVKILWKRDFIQLGSVEPPLHEIFAYGYLTLKNPQVLEKRSLNYLSRQSDFINSSVNHVIQNDKAYFGGAITVRL